MPQPDGTRGSKITDLPRQLFLLRPNYKQYQQVGNAVPPLLARQIAAVVYDLFD